MPIFRKAPVQAERWRFSLDGPPFRGIERVGVEEGRYGASFSLFFLVWKQIFYQKGSKVALARSSQKL